MPRKKRKLDEAQDDALQCRICDKSLPSSDSSHHILSSVNYEEDDTDRSIAEIIGDFADVTLSLDDGRSRYICSACLGAVKKAFQLRQRIQAIEKEGPTILQSIEIEDARLTEQDYEFEYLEEFKDVIPLRGTFETEDTLSDMLLVESDEDSSLRNHQLSEEEEYSLQESQAEQGKFRFVMPPAELIAQRIKFNDFEYLEIRGERCCGCAHIASTRDDLVAHAKEKHSQNYYADSSYTCPTCYQKFPTKELLVKHSQYYLYSDVFLCTTCHEAFNFQRQLMAHLDECHQDGQHEIDETTPEQDDRRAEKKKRDSTKSVALPLALPDEKFISSVREYPNYREYLLSGERCCACGIYMMCLESHVSEAHADPADPADLSDELRCNVCKKTFTSHQEQVLHEEGRKNYNQLYECGVCKMLFSRKNLLLKHYRIAKNHGKLEAEPTEKADATNAGEPTNQTAEGGGSKVPPNMECFFCCFTRCKEEYPTEEELLEHVWAVHSGRRKENEGKLDESRLSDQNLVCPICRRVFDSEEKLTKHRTYKLNLPKQICTQCGQVFMKATGLREHQIRKHLNVQPQFTCEVCGKHFVTRWTLTKHLKVHGPFENYPCSADGCELVFRDEMLMRRHYRNVHKELKPYECSHCQKVFRAKEALDLHMRCHTGERPFPCRYEGCRNRYSHATDRKRHERAAHTGEKPHECPVCNLKFLRLRVLRLHLQVHEKKVNNEKD